MSLLNRLVKVDPNERYSANQALKHPWITGKLEEDIPMTNKEMFQGFEQSQKLMTLMKTLLFM